jgi:hypothetical protein
MVYLLVYSDSFGDRDGIRSFLSSLDEIDHWRYDMPNSFYISSKKNADVIANILANHYENCRFIISEISKNYQGMLSQTTWEFIRNYQED